MNVPGPGVKRALSLSIKAIGKDIRMAVEGGKWHIDCRVQRLLRLLLLLLSGSERLEGAAYR